MALNMITIVLTGDAIGEGMALGKWLEENGYSFAGGSERWHHHKGEMRAVFTKGMEEQPPPDYQNPYRNLPD